MWVVTNWLAFLQEGWEEDHTFGVVLWLLTAAMVGLLVLLYGMVMGVALSGAVALLVGLEGGNLVTDIGFIALLAVCLTILGTGAMITVAVYKLKLAQLRLDAREMDEKLLRESRLALDKELSRTAASKSR